MDEFLLQISTYLETKGVKTDFEKLKKEINADPLMAKLGVDSTASKQQVRELATEIHSALDGIFKNAGVNDFKISIKDVEGVINTTLKQNTKAIENQIAQVQKLRKLQSSGAIDSSVSDSELKYSKLSNTTAELDANFKQLKMDQQALGASTTDEELIANYEKFSTTLTKVNSQMKVLGNEQNSALNSSKLSSNFEKLQYSLESFLNSNPKAVKNMGNEFDDLKVKIANAAQSADATQYKNLSAEFGTLKKKAEAFGNVGETTFSKLGKNAKQFLNYLGSATIIMTAINSIRTVVKNVTKVNAAMTELYKVTDNTKGEYASFFKDATVSAQKYGAKLTDIINSTADWARLGYSLQDSKGLANIATMYKNVGDIDISTATSDLVTALKGFSGELDGAFDTSTEKAEHVADVYNELGNNYAITSAQIGTGISNAASALSTANNTLEQSAAMVTAVTEVTQNASEAGNALKVLSMRLRGAASDDLQSIGEDTDGLITSSSLLRENIKAISGVDIMVDDNTFKSTYQIMQEISKVYDKLSDTSKANLLQIIAGKQRGNQAAALLSNFDTAENALSSALDSTNSAEKENEKYLNSIQGKINQFEASIQSLSTTLLSSGIVKFFVDLGTGAANSLNYIVSTLGSIPSLLLAIGTAAGTIKGVGKLKNVLGVESKKDVMKDIRDAVTNTSENGETAQNTAENVANKEAVDANSTSQTTNAASRAEKVAAIQAENVELAANTEVTGESIVAEESANAVKETTVATNVSATSSFKALGTSILSTAKSVLVFLATNPIGWIVSAAGLLLGASTIIDNFVETIDEAKERLASDQTQYKEATSQINSLGQQLDSVKDKISEINSLDGLSITDKNQLDTLKEQEASLENQLVIQKELQSIAKADATDAAKKILNQQSTSKYTLDESSQDWSNKGLSNKGLVGGSMSGNYKKENQTDLLKEDTDEILKQQESLDNLIAKKEELASANGTESDEYKTLLVDIENTTKARDDARSVASEQYETISQTIEGIDESSDTYKTAKESIDYYASGVAQATNDLDNMTTAQKQASISANLVNSGNTSENDANDFVSSLTDEQLEILASVKFNKDTTIDSLKEVLKDAQDAADKDSVEVKTEVDTQNLIDQLSTAADHASKIADIKNEIEKTGKISASSMNTALQMYPEMSQYLSQYMQGLISEEDLFAQLTSFYNTDENNYIGALEAKNEADGSFYQSTILNNADIVNTFRDNYGIDLTNYSNLAEAKAAIDNKLISTLSENWGEYYGAIKTASGYMLASVQGAGGFDDSDIAGSAEADRLNAEHDARRAAAQSVIDNANAAMSALDDINYDSASAVVDTSWQSMGGYTPYEGKSDSGSGDSSSAEKEFSEDIDWIERTFKALEAAQSRFDEMGASSFETLGTRIRQTENEYENLQKQIQAAADAHEYYQEKADSYDLDDSYKEMVQNGSIGIETITDEDLKNAIDGYQDLYDKATEYGDKEQELIHKGTELRKQNFDNIAKQFENIGTEIGHTANMLQKYIDMSEKTGVFADTSLYTGLIKNKQEELSNLYAEKANLEGQMQVVIDGGDEVGSENWHAMKQQIDSVTEAILDAQVSIADFNKSLRELDYSKFEYMEDAIKNVTSESQFYIDLISKSGKKLYDSETGQYTDEGMATVGLHSQNYSVLLQQATDYSNKIKDINAQLANDPNNKDILAKKQEYIEAQRESVLAAYDERDAIKELVEGQYQAQIDDLNDLIEAREKLIDKEKDEYDYQKSIAEKVANLAKLQKQQNSLMGDDSEENKKTVQELKESIKESKADLEETEYEKRLNDEKEILENLKDELEAANNERADNIDSELKDVSDMVNQNADTISSTLERLSGETNLQLSNAIKDIWSGDTPVSSINSTVSNINAVLTNTNISIEGLRNDIRGMYNSQNAETEATISSNNSDVGDYIGSSDSSYDDSSSSSDDSSDSGSGDVWEGLWNSLTDDQADHNSIVDMLKLNNFDSSWEARGRYYDELGGDGEYYGGDAQNEWLLQKLHESGYAKGSKNILNDEISWTHDGEIIRKSDGGLLRQLDGGTTIVPKIASDNLYDFGMNPSSYISNLKTPDVTSVNKNVSPSISVNVEKIVTPNPTDFTEQLVNSVSSNKNVQNLLVDATISRMQGKSVKELAKYR